MAKKLDINVQNLSSGAKIGIIGAVLVILIGASFFVLIKPKLADIKKLKSEIDAQQKEIAKNEAKAANLSQLKKKYNELEYSLKLLSAQLPEEKEISNLLKQVSDDASRSGLNVTLWKPGAKKVHSSGIVYEIPVDVKMTGSYHSLGAFFSIISGMNRIINIYDISLKKSTAKESLSKLEMSFVAQTFSAIPEEELKSIAAGAEKKGGRR
jgi:type IV pilus assembly protein PilO